MGFAPRVDEIFKKQSMHFNIFLLIINRSDSTRIKMSEHSVLTLKLLNYLLCTDLIFDFAVKVLRFYGFYDIIFAERR